MNIKNRIKQLETQSKEDEKFCRCDAPRLVAGTDGTCQNCLRKFDSKSFRGKETKVILPKVENAE